MKRISYAVVNWRSQETVATFKTIKLADEQADWLDFYRYPRGESFHIVMPVLVDVPRLSLIWRAVRRQYIRFCRMVDRDRPRTPEEIAFWAMK